MRVLLDTNIILDFFLEREPFFQLASEVFEAIAAERIEGLISASSATDIFYICKRQTQNLEQARQILTQTLTLLSVCPVDYTVLNTALNSGLVDFEDAVQIACAVAQQVDAIVTRNPQDFQTTAVSIFTVSQLLEHFREK
ncbi:PIN domain-containing protein [Coleofasciculus chthonoplastes]|uniref:PIN domain-containing protein n=1 Tax=Coleofasciculus chthonoplastes TaxID=64178 RepID=UPI0032F9FCA6